MWKRRLTLPALLAMVLAGLTGCGGGDSKPPEEAAADGMVSTTTTTAPVPTAPSLIVTARDYAFDDIPPEIEGGVVRMTFENKGERKHSAVIVDAGDSPPDRMLSGRRFYGGVSLVEGGTSWAATVSLPPGRYAMVCPLTDADTFDPSARPPDPAAQRHFERGMLTEFVVERTNTAVMPPTDGTVVAREWSYEVPQLPTGLKTLTFRNDGQQPHSLTIAELPDGAAAGAPETGAEVAYAALSPGGEVTVSLMLEVNRTYAFVCHLHPDKGMIARATVPSG